MWFKPENLLHKNWWPWQPSKIVEINKSFLRRRKNNAGKSFSSTMEFWGNLLETTECFLVEVKIGLRLHLYKQWSSDCWRSFKRDKLNYAAFNCLTVYHTCNFVDPQTSAHTQNVKRLSDPQNCASRNIEVWLLLNSSVVKYLNWYSYTFSCIEYIFLNLNQYFKYSINKYKSTF